MRSTLPASIFNDVIGPVMREPSSSHSAAAPRIGRLARDPVDGRFQDVLVEFDPEGSLPTTHESQASDMGWFGGLLGWDAVDERLPGSPQGPHPVAKLSSLKERTAGSFTQTPGTFRL